MEVTDRYEVNFPPRFLIYNDASAADLLYTG